MLKIRLLVNILVEKGNACIMKLKVFHCLVNINPKTGKMARFAMEFPFQFLDFSIEISKDWNGNSKSKRTVIPGL